MTNKVIIDTDPGHDDALALMLAGKSAELELLAVTTVCGNSTIENTTRNARFIMDFINRNDVPIYSGAEKPLQRELVQAVVHGESGLAGVDPTNDSGLTEDAVDRILATVKENPNEVTIITLGPLTNVALAIKRDPKTMELVKEVISMGGAIDVAGNKNRVAEFNIFVDPEAAAIVMNFPVSKTLVPLDACNHVVMQMEDLARIKDASLRDLLERMFVPYIANLAKDAGEKGAMMYDPLTVFYLLQPDSCQTVELSVLVETRGEVTRGMTVVDKRKVGDKLAPNVKVVMNINSEDFMKRFIQALNGSRAV